jgi:sugar transferase (PEP-CTERM system associated)
LGGRIIRVLSGENGAGGEKTSVPFPVLGTAAEVEKVAQQHRISRVIVALEDRRGVLPVRALLRLRFEGIPVEEAHDTLAALNGRVSLKTIQPSWFIFSEGFHRSRLNLIAKRISDLIFGTAGLLLALPIMAGVALAVALDSGRPVIYRQQRVGLRGRTFDVLKFRSMRTDAEKSGKPQWAAAADPRVTRIGKYLRKFRFDELPQFINIIRGEMSFVGPRPERPAFVEQLRNVIPYYDERHRVRPGLTGWAQVQYSYGSSEEDAFRKLEYDLFYLKNMSVTFDLMIVAKTLRIIATGEGAR